MAVDSLQLNVAGKPYVATQAGDGKINLASADGKDVQSMDVEKFKAYLAERAKAGELQMTPPTQAGDKTSFKGKEEETAEAPEKKGISIGTKLLTGAALIGLGIWKKDKVAEYWGKLKGLINKTGGEAAKASGTEGEKVMLALPPHIAKCPPTPVTTNIAGPAIPLPEKMPAYIA